MKTKEDKSFSRFLMLVSAIIGSVVSLGITMVSTMIIDTFLPSLNWDILWVFGITFVVMTIASRILIWRLFKL
tara:strand:+ start:8445 stop:8663 length:219 start_codon:yes stop_codon:yes gene_type:complete